MVITKQIVVFEIEKQSYGIDIQEVNEIIHMREITSIPNTSVHVEGVLNLRGTLCSIVNGRTLLGMEKRVFSQEDKIIVIDEAKIGMVVDEVSEILTVEEGNVKTIKGMEGLMKLGFIDYIVESENTIISVLKIKKLLVPEEQEVESEVLQS